MSRRRLRSGCASVNLSQFCAAIQNTPKLNGGKRQGCIRAGERGWLGYTQWTWGVTLPHPSVLPPGTSGWPGHILFMVTVKGQEGRNTQGLFMPRWGLACCNLCPHAIGQTPIALWVSTLPCHAATEGAGCREGGRVDTQLSVPCPGSPAALPGAGRQ